METLFARELEMFEQTNAYLDDHIAIWIAIPIVSNYKNRIHQLIPTLKESLIGKDTSKVHMGQAILHLKKQIADKMDILDDTLEAYADDIGNEKLRQQAANYYSDYFRLPYDDFVDKVTKMIDLLEIHVNNMGDYGLVQDQIDDVKLNLDEYQLSLGKSQTYDMASKIARQDKDKLIGEAEEYADKLDKVMKRFKRSNFTFYNGYLAARTIVEY
ncbi:hypothetical protein [Ekhidna sp.]